MASVTQSRSMQFSDGSSDKFWKIELSGSEFTVVYGRTGTNGQTQTKSFGSDDEARKAYDKLVAEKVKKGYTDVGGAPAASAPATAVPVADASAAVAAPTSAKPKKAASKARKTDTATADSSNVSPATTATPTAAAPAAPANVELRVAREILLNPLDWYRAGSCKLPLIDRGTPAPFDVQSCVERMSKLKKGQYGWRTLWKDLKLAPALSREEAHFWLVAMTTPRDRNDSLADQAQKLAKRTYDGNLSTTDVWALIEKHNQHCENVEPMQMAASLLTPHEFVDWILDPQSIHKRQSWEELYWAKERLNGFRKYVAPYLTPAELKSLQDRIQQTWKPHQPGGGGFYPMEYYLAAALRMPDLIYSETSHWPDDLYSKAPNPQLDYTQRPQDLLFGLGSPEVFVSEWRRLKLKLRSEDDVRAFLACSDFQALDVLSDYVLTLTNKEECASALELLALVHAPEAAMPMLQCKLSSKMPQAARQWLDHWVGNTATGLIEVAGGRGGLADAAIDQLRALKQAGHAATLAQAVKDSPHREAAARVQTEVLDHEVKSYVPLDAASTPAPINDALQALGKFKKKSVPSWTAASSLPPLLVGDRRLNDEQVEAVVQMLVATPITQKHPLLTAVREHASKQSRDEFVWKLFRNWQDDGTPSKEKWAMGSIGHLGDDGSVLKLTPLIRNWPGESQHARAVFGLECLRAIGSSVALMQLSGIAQKLKFKGLKTKAEEFVTEIANEKGLTRDELEDRVVPDCGLDEKGRREFSFGPRSFSFVLSGDLKPMIRDEAGKVRPNLPDPNSKDDATVAEESVAEWKLLKKQIKDVAAIQAARLEQAMVTGRRWNREDFESLLVRHPLMTHLVQKLIWGGFDAAGKRVTTFRVTEERDYADPEDEALSLEGVAGVGVVHPLELSDAERSRWGEVFSDYEIISPFPQLSRPGNTLEPGEGETDDLKRFHGLKLVAPTLVFTLEKMGWTRGVGMDGGGFDEHSKQFPAADVTAVIQYEGNVGMGYIDPDELLTLESIHFCPGKRPPSGYGWDSKTKLKLKDVNPIVFSEVVADLQVLKSKAK